MGEMKSLRRGARIHPQTIRPDTTTIVRPILSAYALANRAPRKPRRVYDRHEELRSRP
jgi:hypothetical protein